jgi:ubiquinone/menaquinone biosynthesis C-methylase UbiE
VSDSDSHPIFDEFAEEYERHAAEGAYNAWYDRPAVLELIGEVTGQRVLDAGCGPGLYAEQLVARGAEVVAFDHSPKMVDLARNRLGDQAMVRVHDLADPLDWLEDDSFDAALLALVIHHLDDRVAALRELYRVLRPGGRLVVSTHHPTADWLRQGGSYFTIETIEETWSPGWSVRYWRLPLTATCAEFAQAGFLIERLVEPRPAPGMVERFPDDYDKLNREPGFISFRLVKPS